MGKIVSADEALAKLKKGNETYIAAKSNPGDVSPEIRKETMVNGQSPYAIVVTCSDSRVIPEAIFSAGIGDLFTIRVAGNVIDSHQLGSVEYAAEHLGTRLCVVLGHTNCGAVGAALADNPDSYIQTLVDEIREAIGTEKDPSKATRLNAEYSAKQIKEKLHIPDEDGEAFNVMAAIYNIGDGSVEFI
ncbi:MAG: carbonic anhydrase [Eubacterium sp.]|nr:carbonic anhydrase [Eubacterium sp.]